eukprot:TCONS_00072931-protein
MVGVLKLMHIAYTVTDADLKGLFKTHAIYPEDVHWLTNKHGKKTGTAFIAFQKEDLKKAQELDGIYFRGHKMNIHASSAHEFNSHFPNTPMTKNIGQEWKLYGRPKEGDLKFESEHYETRKINRGGATGYDQYYESNFKAESSYPYTTQSRFEERGAYSAKAEYQDYAASYNTYQNEALPKRDVAFQKDMHFQRKDMQYPTGNYQQYAKMESFPTKHFVDTEISKTTYAYPPKKDTSNRREPNKKRDLSKSHSKKDEDKRHRHRSRSPTSRSKYSQSKSSSSS